MREPSHRQALGQLLACALLALLLAGCGDGKREPAMQQTGLAGHLTAGGGSSGEVMKPVKEAVQSTAPAAGTPGIPQGAGGTTGGAAMGGTTTGAQLEAEKAKQLLTDSMDAVSARWRSRATASGWQVFSPTPVDPVQGFNASAAQSGASAQPGGRLDDAAGQAPPRSEKSGTAVPSADVKDDSKRAAPTGVNADAPNQVSR